MNNRIYNILYHTHTVSGIVISVALFVIFFTGTFSFFRDEIINWERGHEIRIADEISIPPDTVLAELGKQYRLYGRSIDLRHYYNERRVSVSLGPSVDSLAPEEDKTRAFFYLDTDDKSTAGYEESYTLGEFLYRLHFFAQIPYPAGYYLSGFVAFFFLFAICTGMIIHWKKIISNFFVFRPWAKLKTMWTDAHTALGLIGFPFQLVYALTGAFFMLKALIVAPFIFSLYAGDDKKFYRDLEYALPDYAFNNTPLEYSPSLQPFIDQTKAQWRDFRITDLKIAHFGDTNMHLEIAGNLPQDDKFNGLGRIVYKVVDGQVIYKRDPVTNNHYLDGVKNVLYRLHFANYAGYGLRIISFILGLISCFVILSGVMIWLTAREKTNISDQKRRFNQTVVSCYLAICLSMIPMIALEFLLVKIFAPAGMTIIYRTFFGGWLILSLLFFLKRDHASILRWSLLSGACLGILVPVVNGMVSGHWFWQSTGSLSHANRLVDLLWFTLSMISLVVLFQLERKTLITTGIKKVLNTSRMKGDVNEPVP